MSKKDYIIRVAARLEVSRIARQQQRSTDGTAAQPYPAKRGGGGGGWSEWSSERKAQAARARGGDADAEAERRCSK